MLVPKVILFVFLLGLAHSKEEEQKFQNQLEQKLCAECSKGYAIHKVTAEAGTTVVDRQWRWECEKVGDWEKHCEEHCRTFEDINDHNKFMAFRCPKDSYISGIWSTYLEQDSSTDRIWTVRCCTQPGLCVSKCELTDYLSDFDGDMEHCAPYSTYFVGLFSHMDRPSLATLGRKWKIGQCRFESCSLSHYLKEYGYDNS